MSERKAEADKQYAMLSNWQPTRGTEDLLQGAITIVAAIREQTEVLSRIAAALEWRDVVEVRYLESTRIAGMLLEAGWVYLGEEPTADPETVPRMVLGRSRNVPKDAEGGGEPL